MVDSSSVSDAGGAPDSPWPPLPDGCPPDDAQPRDGEFYRLVDRSERDWQNHVQINGEAWCLERSKDGSICKFHALSIFGELEDVLRIRDSGGAFTNHIVVRFHVQRDWGVHDKAKYTSHHNWFPHGSEFVPPPDPLEIIDDSGGP